MISSSSSPRSSSPHAACPASSSADAGSPGPDSTVVVLATRNAGKVRELAEPLAAFGLRVVGLDAFPDFPEVEETGTTFAENALLKARAVAEGLGLTAVADDSGLEVDALDGAPGVYSARYSDDTPELPGANKDARNNAKLLKALAGVPEAARGARFRCAMAVVRPDGRQLLAEGTWEGRIGLAPAGANGFGYDPLFCDLELQRTAAELSREEKMARSHRARALAKLLDQWEGFWTSTISYHVPPCTLKTVL